MRQAMTACAALLLAAFANLPLPAAAQPSETRTATARLIRMPAGDHENRARQQLGLKAHKLRYALSASRLAAVKAKTGARATDTLAPEAAPRLAAPTVVKTCTTNSADVFTPSDINGAASPTHIVSVTNDAIGVYRIDGCSTLSRLSLEDFVSLAWSIPPTQEVFDPRVMYDPSIGRFVMTAETFDDVNTDQYQYLAVSTDGTASAWYIYQIPLSEVATSTVFCKLAAASFWDYPMLGRSSNRWFMTANDFPTGRPDEASGAAPVDPTAPRGAILTMDKAPTLTGAAVTFGCFKNLAVNIAAPIVKTADPAAFFLSPDGNGEGSSLRLYSVTAGVSASGDALAIKPVVPIPAWSAAPNAPQPNGQKLDTLDGRFQSPSIQINNKLWNVHTVNVNGHARWRLYKFARTATGLQMTMNVTPSSVAAQNDNLFNPSVDTRSSNPADPAWVTFSRTIPSDKTLNGNAAMLIAHGPNAGSSGWASRRTAISADQYLETGFRAGSTSCNNDPDIHTCRWGDYSSTQIDPVDTTRAWGFNQLIIGRTSKNWTTKGSLVK